MTASSRTAHALIESCQGLVRSLAYKLHRRLPSSFDVEDLISYGQIGLAEAARDFDPDRGQQFSTYAYYRIRGAMYDGLAKISWNSRARYRQLRFEQLAGDALGVEGEDAAQPGDLHDDVRWLKKLAGAIAVVYLTTDPDGDDTGEADTALADRSTPNPLSAAIAQETKTLLHRLIDALPGDSGSLIRDTYFQGMSLQQAGERIGVSKAWASRLHAKTLDRLARALRLLGVEE